MISIAIRSNYIREKRRESNFLNSPVIEVENKYNLYREKIKTERREIIEIRIGMSTLSQH